MNQRFNPGNLWRVRHNTHGNTERVTVKDGTETIEKDSEAFPSAGHKLPADLVQPFTPESQMQRWRLAIVLYLSAMTREIKLNTVAC
jgi:hypothetical protein